MKSALNGGGGILIVCHTKTRNADVCEMHKYLPPNHSLPWQHWAEPSAAAVRLAGLLGRTSSSPAHKEAAIFGHLSWQNSSSLVGLDGDWAAIFMSHHKFLIGWGFGLLSNIKALWQTPFRGDYGWHHRPAGFILYLLAHRSKLVLSIFIALATSMQSLCAD